VYKEKSSLKNFRFEVFGEMLKTAFFKKGFSKKNYCKRTTRYEYKTA